MQSEQFLDTREGAELERASARYLEQSRATIIRVVQQSKRLDDPPANSWLGRVDGRTAPFETSQIVRTFALVAADNLRQVDRVLRRDNALPPFALYSMIRSGVEASSLGLWILDAKDEQLAASRTLRIYRQNIESDRTMWRDVVGRSNKSHDALELQARALHDRLTGVSADAYDRAVRSSAAIDRVDALRTEKTGLEYGPLRGLEVWRAASSIVHANPVSMLHLLERHPDGGIGDSATRTSRLSFVAAFLVTGARRTEELINTYRSRSKPRRTGR